MHRSVSKFATKCCFLSPGERSEEGGELHQEGGRDRCVESEGQS